MHFASQSKHSILGIFVITMVNESKLWNISYDGETPLVSIKAWKAGARFWGLPPCFMETNQPCSRRRARNLALGASCCYGNKQAATSCFTIYYHKIKLSFSAQCTPFAADLIESINLVIKGNWKSVVRIKVKITPCYKTDQRWNVLSMVKLYDETQIGLNVKYQSACYWAVK